MQIRWGLLTLLATMFWGLTTFADGSLLDQPSYIMISEPKLISGKKAKITVTEYDNLNEQELGNLVSDPRLNNVDTLVATQNPELIKVTALSHLKSKSKKLIRFLPLGKLASGKKWAQAQFDTYKQNVRHTLNTDKFGVTVVSVVYGVEQYILIMDPAYSWPEKVSLTVINTVFTGLFSLDRDLFMRLIKNPREKLFQRFDKLFAPKKMLPGKTLLSQYLSSLGLNSILNFIRYSSLGIDGISDSIDPTRVVKDTAIFPSLATASAFSWAGLNEEARKKGHQSRILLRRLSDMRSMIMIAYGSTAAMFSATSLFSAPVATYVISTTMGLVLFLKSEKILNWTQNSVKAAKIFEWNQSVENFVNRIFSRPERTKIRDLDLRKPEAIRSCQALFAG